MKSVWQESQDLSWLWGAAGSAVLHVVLAVVLFLLPAEARDRILDTVDLSVTRKQKVPERQEPDREEPPDEKKVQEPEVEEVQVEKTVPRKARPSRAKEPEPEKTEPPPKPPPKFTMSGGTFADEGSWSLAAEVGESRFGSLDGQGEYEPGDDQKSTDKAPAPAPAPKPKPKKPKFSPAKSSEVKAKPKVILEQTIPYPAEARKLGIEGKVRLRVDIDEKGKVLKVTVLQDPGGGLGKAAAKALKGFLFSPAVSLSGKPVDYRITYVYVFELE